MMRFPLAALVLLSTSACAPPPYDTGATASTEPSIAFSWPEAEGEYTGCVVATVNIANFRLVDFATHADPVDGEGHWHLEHPAGPSTYDVCTRPYCVAHFEALEGGPVADFLVAALATNDHQAVLDADGNRIETRLPATFTGGTCDEALGGGDDTGGSW